MIAAGLKAATIFILILLLMYQCPEPCTYSSSKSNGLTRHQLACQVWRTSQMAGHLRRHKRAVSARGGTQSVLTRRKERINQNRAGAAEDHGYNITIDPSENEGHDLDPISTVEASMPLAEVISTSTHISPPSLPEVTPSGRPRRNYTLPSRYRDVLPDPIPVLEELSSTTSHIPRVLLRVRDSLVTARNAFGLWRNYLFRPSYDPGASIPACDLQQSDQVHHDSPLDQLSTHVEPPPWPFKNMSIYRLLLWQNTGSTTKSGAETSRLANDVLNATDFIPSDLGHKFDAQRENQHFDSSMKKLRSTSFFAQFAKANITIDVPSGEPRAPAGRFEVPGLLYRKITSVIQTAFQAPLAHHYHLSPFKLFHISPTTNQEERVFGEIYTSDAFLEEHKNIQDHAQLPPDDPHCKREKVIAALMFSSDATHLTNFGTAKAWPIYLMLGNLSKYIRSQPGSGAMHHLAYIPSLPDSFQDYASRFHKKWRTQHKEILTHCRRELMHAVWRFLLDDDFVHAYKYGIVIQCIDGIERRVYPRIFTYSADYPEKTLLATIRDQGHCPCPRCLIQKGWLDRLGLIRDRLIRTTQAREFLVDKVIIARNAIYNLGLPIGGAQVNALLKEFSGVPTLNAFAHRLSLLGPSSSTFNPSHMLVVDLLHEFELGVWKTLFTHLIRLLYSASPGGALVEELDKRYRQTPTFGRDTVRRFATNASEMRKLAARDFEDLLQCSIPAFEGLLPPPHNQKLMKLLYRTAEWHALAKARMHTEQTLALLEDLTKDFGQLIRAFRDLTCSQYQTYELPCEVAARNRRETKKRSDIISSTIGTRQTNIHPESPMVDGTTISPHDPMLGIQANSRNIPKESPPRTQSVRRPKTLNLSTYKLHSLGDYVQMIKLYGTTDSYSTQLGESAHRLIKRFFGKTNKKDALTQIANQYTRQAVLGNSGANLSNATELVAELQCLDNAPSHERYHTSQSRNKPINLYSFVKQRPFDPAKYRFIPKLQEHLLGRLENRNFDGDTHESYTPEDLNTIRIRNNTIYSIQLLRVNYTTYDILRDYDIINPNTHHFVIVQSPESEDGAYPYWYAQVLGIFHADVNHTGPCSQNPYKCHAMTFLWVRWLGVVPKYVSTRKRARLPKLGFIPDDDPFAFGFLDPACIIRGSHLIPAFDDGRTSTLLNTTQTTAARPPDEVDDWVAFYVDIFVDRDMLFRYLGGAIGHLGNARGGVGATTAEDDDDDESHSSYGAHHPELEEDNGNNEAEDNEESWDNDNDSDDDDDDDNSEDGLGDYAEL